jgi:hypothetical protein
MKLLRKILYILPTTALIITLPAISSCDKCDDVKKGAKLADLAIESYDEIYQDDVAANPYYELIFEIVNSAIGIECPEEVSAAGPHEDELALLYSTDPNMADAELVQEKNIAQTEVTNATESYEITNEVEFDVDGYYSIAIAVDEGNSISERNEANNTGSEAIGRSTGRSSKNFHYIKVVKVTNTGNSKPKVENGRKIYFKRWDSKIR